MLLLLIILNLSFAGNGINAQCSENMLFERINASGVGLTIGSIGANSAHTCVRVCSAHPLSSVHLYLDIF